MSDTLINRINQLAVPAIQDEEIEARVSKMIRTETPLIEVTVAQVRKLCLNNPEHPLAESKLKSVSRMPDNAKVAIQRVDAEALLENKEVVEEITEERRGDKIVPIRRLKLGASVPPKKHTLGGE